MQCSDTVDTALAELMGLQSRSQQYTPGTNTITATPSFGAGWHSGSSRDSRRYNPHFSCQGSSISSSSVNQQQQQQQQQQTVQMHPKFISKVTSIEFPRLHKNKITPFLHLQSPRKICELPAFRMRPYFLPERSRTKSESLDMNMTSCSGGSLNPVICSGTDVDNELNSTTCTTNSSTYAMMTATLMDTGGTTTTTSRSPGILYPQCSFDYEVTTDVAVLARGYSMEPRKMRLKKLSNLLKKSRSLEDVRAEEQVDGSQLSHEMEFVSSRIQKLKVQEPE